MPFAAVNGVRLFYEERGTGPGMLFLNGLAGDHVYWKAQLRSFSRNYHCVALDNRDAGQSENRAAPYQIKDLAADAAAVIEQLRLSPARVIGLSMGGMIAQELATLRPELVHSLALVDTLAQADGWFLAVADAFEFIRRLAIDTPAFFEAILPWWVGSRFLSDSDRGAWLKWMLRQSSHPQPLDGFLRQLDAMRQHDALSRLSSVRCPTLILTGAEDAIMPVRYAEQMKAAIPHAELRLLDGVGHALPLEIGRQFDAIVREFLSHIEESDAVTRN